MKKILVSILIITVTFSCKKESQNRIAEVLNDVPPCTGNTWSLVTGWPFYVYPSNAEFDYVVFNAGNKLYAPCHNKQRMYIFDGVGWTYITSAVPWNYDRNHFTSFTVGDKGYVFNDDVFPKLFEYNTSNNTWTDKGFFPATGARFSSYSFVIGNKAYVIGGYYYGPQNYKYVWEYESSTNTWIQKTDFPPGYGGRAGGAAFTINGKGYIVGGLHYYQGNPGYPGYNNEVFEYDPSLDNWTPKAGFPGNMDLWSTNAAAAFVMGSSAYVSLNGKNFYSYNPTSNLWSNSATLNTRTGDLNECTAVINSKGYVFNASGTNQMYQYAPTTCNAGSN